MNGRGEVRAGMRMERRRYKEEQRLKKGRMTKVKGGEDRM